MRNKFKTMQVAVGALFLMAACDASKPDTSVSDNGQSEPSADLTAPSVLEAQLEALLVDYKMATAGAAIIRNAEIAWTGYYGESTSGVAASDMTLFNVDSMVKTVAAETIVRLADKAADFDPWVV